MALPASTLAGLGISRTALATITMTSLLLFVLYWVALPRPIPGIPYNKHAARQIWGDVPEMKKAKRVRGWMQDQFARHNSPIVQLFMFPFRRPWVYVSDFCEAHDVMLRRTKDFDRSSLTAECFSGVMPEFQMNMKSADPRHKRNRDLLKDLMAPTFLNKVTGPQLYEKMLAVLELWTVKAEIADGRPFEAETDIYTWALDFIMAVAFNTPQSDTMTVKQTEHLKSQDQREEPDEMTNELHGSPLEFSRIPLVPELYACNYLANSIGVAFQSPIPRLAHFVYLQKPHSRKQTRIKKQLIKRNIDESLKRIGLLGERQKLTCAVDQILLRERDRARKQSVEPDYYKNAIQDELFGFVAAGHDTTSTTIQWWVKYMSLSQPVQCRLRHELRQAHSGAWAEKRLPSIREITSTNIPYLEATIEESFRCSHIIPFITREAIVDTQILGHRIPKGTQVLFAIGAESFVKPAFKLGDEPRAKGAERVSARCMYGVWDPADIGLFSPERWLKVEVTSAGDNEVKVAREVFDPKAGPSLSFGAGPRSCFGRRLSYLEMRVVVTLLTWAFEFLEISSELNSLESIDTSTEAPKECLVRLRRVQY